MIIMVQKLIIDHHLLADRVCLGGICAPQVYKEELIKKGCQTENQTRDQGQEFCKVTDLDGNFYLLMIYKCDGR